MKLILQLVTGDVNFVTPQYKIYLLINLHKIYLWHQHAGKDELNWKLAQTTIWEPAGYRITIEADLAQFLGRHNYFNYRSRDIGEFGDILAIDDIRIYSGVCVPNSKFVFKKFGHFDE